MLAGENISARFVVPTVAASVDLVAHLAIDQQGRRTVEEILAVPGRAEGDTIETEALFVRRAGELVRAGGMPPRPDRYQRVGVDIVGLLSEGT
jgi:pilus assembly protein CpaF